MANRRQRRKQTSGSYKPVRVNSAKKLRKVPTIQGPLAIQKAWDKKKSLHQNYAALGLAMGSRPITGPGAAPWPTATAALRVPVSAPVVSNGVPRGHARIIRDADGKVVGIEESTEDVAEAAALPPWEARPLNPLDDITGDVEVEEEVNPKPKTALIKELEAQSIKWAKGASRPPSANEKKWLVTLVAVYGDDLDAMHMDTRRNVWQRTPGELRKAIKKAGGIDHLRELAKTIV